VNVWWQSFLFFQQQMPLDTPAASLLLRNVQDKFIGVSEKSPHEPDPAAIGTCAQDFYSLAVYAAGCLRSGTAGVLEIARLAVQI
jgi:hypothetical protein